jgi:hypothetical protein
MSIPNCLHTYCTNPEQSNPDGVVPPHTYGTPKYFLASSNICSPVTPPVVDVLVSLLDELVLLELDDAEVLLEDEVLEDVELDDELLLVELGAVVAEVEDVVLLELLDDELLDDELLTVPPACFI